MKQKILETIKKYNLINSKDKVVVGVSGGPDSMTLLNILLEIKEEKLIDFDLCVCHINHMIRKEAISDELEERGMTPLDFQLLCAWNFYDTQVFSADSLDAIIKIANRNTYVENKQRLPAAVAMGISNAFTRNMAWCWCFVCVLILLFTEKKSRLYPWVSLALVVASYIYLLQLNKKLPFVPSIQT